MESQENFNLSKESLKENLGKVRKVINGKTCFGKLGKGKEENEEG